MTTSVIPVLVGPTSSGKTSLALEYCKKHDAVILSADSRQIYKYMDIGTGKKPLTSHKIVKGDGLWSIDGITIYGYDLVMPDEYYSGYDFAKYARNKIIDLIHNGKKIIMVGGTGFYVDLVTGRLQLTSNAPDINLRKTLDVKTLDQLQKQLESISVDKYASIDKNNKNRLIRAIEITQSNEKDQPLPPLPNITFKLFGLTASREYLYTRADNWVDAIFENGILDETADLYQKFPTSDKLNGLVYKTAAACNNSEISLPEAIQKTKWDIHAYIRRQQTWFKKITEITWLNIEAISQKDCIIKLDE